MLTSTVSDASQDITYLFLAWRASGNALGSVFAVPVSCSMKCPTKCDTEVWWIFVYFNLPNLLSFIIQYCVTPWIKLWSCFYRIKAQLQEWIQDILVKTFWQILNLSPFPDISRFLKNMLKQNFKIHMFLFSLSYPSYMGHKYFPLGLIDIYIFAFMYAWNHEII